MKRKELSGIDIANAVIYYTNKTYGSGVMLTGLKLHKIVYYIACEYAKKYGSLLFRDVIEKWRYGATVINLYHKLKHREFQYEHIKTPLPTFDIVDGEFVLQKFNYYDIPEPIRTIVEYVTVSLVELTTKEIVDMIQNEDAWKSNKEAIFSSYNGLRYTLQELIDATKIEEKKIMKRNIQLDDILPSIPTKSTDEPMMPKTSKPKIEREEFNPNKFLWCLHSFINFIGGNPSSNFQTKLVNKICDAIEEMDEEELKKRVVFNRHIIHILEKDLNGFITIWWTNEYYAVGSTYAFRNLKDVNKLPKNKYPDMKTRMRLMDLKKRLFSDKIKKNMELEEHKNYNSVDRLNL